MEMNGYSNNTTCNNSMAVADEQFEELVRVIVPTIFGMFVVVGVIGNLLVIAVVLSNKQMRNTTNILIVSLAVADISFLVFCIPFTAVGYAKPVWPFGNIWCKIVHYLIYVCAYASVYTLVLMSLDRYLAVVFAIRSMTMRTERNAYILVGAIWLLILLGNIPMLWRYEHYGYVYHCQYRTACLDVSTLRNPQQGQIFYGSFFAFGYAIPLVLICILYGFMLKRLLYGVVPGGNQSVESIRSKKRVTRMVVVVVAIFAMCWLPIQVIFMIQYFGDNPGTPLFISLQMACNLLAYMNSCINPILYAFLSENFRKSFQKLICCCKPTVTKYDYYERTNCKGLESTALQSLNNASQT